MEKRFHHDFSSVRIHADTRADASARAMGAKAYTVGKHISFRDGLYSPGTTEGNKLLAHELTHSVQQSRGGEFDTASRLGGGEERRGVDTRAETEADQNAEHVASESTAEVQVAARVGVAMKGDTGAPPLDHPYWFQDKAPEKPTSSGPDGIEIAPKDQVFIDPSTSTVAGITVQFAGKDKEFPGGKAGPKFVAAKKSVLDALRFAIKDLNSLPDIPSMPLEELHAKRKKDETVRARLKETTRTLSGKTLNVFIASDLTVAEMMSNGPLSLSTTQVFVTGDDIGHPDKLEAAIRIPLVELTGGDRVSGGSAGGAKNSTITALTDEQLKEGVLHELVHVMLINKHISAAQVWRDHKKGAVSGPDDVKAIAEDVLSRYMRAQEEIFVYTAIEDIYTNFAGNKSIYEAFAALVEAFVNSVGGSVTQQKPVSIDVKEKIGEKKKEGVSWSIQYSLPAGLKVDAGQMDTLKKLKAVDPGT